MAVVRRQFIALGAGGLAASLGARPSLAADQVIVVGVSIPLTGPGAATGITTQRTLERGVELINAEGIAIGPDKYTLKLVFYDNKYVPAEAVTVVEKLLADGVRVLISLGSGNSVPVVAKTNAVQALQLQTDLRNAMARRRGAPPFPRNLGFVWHTKPRAAPLRPTPD